MKIETRRRTFVLTLFLFGIALQLFVPESMIGFLIIGLGALIEFFGILLQGEANHVGVRNP